MKHRSEIWREVKEAHTRCSRCLDWERWGLAYFCPTCDHELLAEHDRRCAQQALTDFDRNGGTPLADLRRELKI